MMQDFRNNPPRQINGQEVILVKDYKFQKAYDLKNGTDSPIDLPSSDVLQFFLASGSKITVRPSGTEPKIKFYIGVKGLLTDKEQFKQINSQMNDQLQEIITSMGLR